MELNDAVYSMIKTTPGVTGFIGTGKKPSPVPQGEAEVILKRIEETQVKPSPKVVFDEGDQVRVTQGPFVNFNGTIDEIHPEKGKLKVSVSIFGRATPVELEYWQVEKI
jgi:transcriptional antiterminator NusG